MTEENRRILIIDDERPILLTLEALLGRHGYQPETAATAAYGMRLLQSNSPAVVLLDLQLPDADGLEMLGQIKREHPETQVIILTAHDSLSNAIESIKRGAYHFISKPYAPEELLSLIEKALEKQSLLRETEELRAKTQQLEKRLEIAETRLAPVFKSKAMQEIHELISAMAPSEANVLITGESGVGKEVIANVIHSRSRRAAKPMVKLNCAAFPQAMIESELFGYVKGAFTGATNDFRGMIAAASGSTLFLDEISEMPAELQTRFLRVLQEREYRPLGSTKTLESGLPGGGGDQSPDLPGARGEPSARPIFITGSTLSKLKFRHCASGKRTSLRWSRLSSNASRRSWANRNRRSRRKRFRNCSITAGAGNVRELQNAMEYAVVLARQAQIGIKELPAEVQLPVALQKSDRNHGRDAGVQNLDDLERNAILQALAQCHGNKKKAAQVLGIQRPTLYNKMKRYAIEL